MLFTIYFVTIFSFYRHDRLTLEVEAREKAWLDKEKMYETQLTNSNSTADKLSTQINTLEEKLQKSENSRNDSESSTISKISELESAKNEFQLQVKYQNENNTK